MKFDAHQHWAPNKPLHWRWHRVGDAFHTLNGFPFESEHFNTEGAGLPLVRIRDILGDGLPTYYSGANGLRCLVMNGDVVIGMDGDFNCVWWNKGPALLNQRVAALRVRSSGSIHPRFAFYQIPFGLKAINDLTPSSTVKHLSSFDIAALRLPAPDLPTQKRIADFLDRETGRIDELIGKKEQLVEVLKARFDMMVQDAVTKGRGLLGISLRPSGVDYLGRVPEHWSVEKVGWRYSVQLGKMLDASKQTGQQERPYLRVADVQWDAINSDDLPVMDFSPADQQRFQIRTGDLLVNEGGSYVGRSAIWRGATDVVFYQKALHRLRPHNSHRDSTEYMLWVMWFATKEGIFVANGNQTTIDHLTAEAFKAYRFPFPPRAEQEIIADQLRRERDRSKALEAQIQLSIDRLREYRAALITAAVTGQIDVDSYGKAGKTSATLDRIEEEMQA